MFRVFRWGYERGKVKMNPCTGVKKFKEKARTRYITNQEYSTLYNVASPLVRIAMEIAYLCCARQGDILDMKKGQLTESGILIQQSKTAVAQIKSWADRLRAAVAMADLLPIS